MNRRTCPRQTAGDFLRLSSASEEQPHQTFGNIGLSLAFFNDTFFANNHTYPNVLVSANQGIAVGMASQLCGFNLAEVCDATAAYLKDPNCDLSSIILGPDFPTGGDFIYDAATLNDVYNTGRGSLKIRGKYRYNKSENIIEVCRIQKSTLSEEPNHWTCMERQKSQLTTQNCA